MIVIICTLNLLSVDLRLRELTVTGQKQGERLPVLVKSRIAETENQLELFFEINPVDKVMANKTLLYSIM